MALSSGLNEKIPVTNAAGWRVEPSELDEEGT
jgi:hypothetical protein